MTILNHIKAALLYVRHYHAIKWSEVSRDKPWFFGAYGFILENQKPIPFIPLKGQLGFFNSPEVVEVTV